MLLNINCFFYNDQWNKGLISIKVKNIHSFDLSTNQRDAIQEELKEKLDFSPLSKLPKRVGGVDITYLDDNRGICSIVVLDFSTKEIIEEKHEIGNIDFDYMPGYLAFREIPLFLKTWEKIECEPDLVFFDGNGILHPKQMGLASHASFFIEKPTVGIAKTPIFHYEMPENKRGAYTYIERNNHIIGAALRTKANVKPIFVSIGNRISLEESISFALELTDDAKHTSRLPIVTHIPDQVSRNLRKELLLQSSINKLTDHS